MNWGKWIVVVFVMFAVFIGVLVYYCVREDVSLVTPDYYKEELAFQQQIERLKNTEDLDQKPRMTVVASGLVISFNQLPFFTAGEVVLFRPSDKNFDRKFNFSVNADTIQRFDLSNMPAGMYKARMKWKMKGKEYFFEQIINR